MSLQDPSYLREQRRAELDRGRVDYFGERLEEDRMRVSGPCPEIANTPEYQALNGQAIHEQVEASKWAMVQAVLIDSKQFLQACAQSYEGERQALLVAMALEHDARIGAAGMMRAHHEVQRDKMRADMKALENRRL